MIAGSKTVTTKPRSMVVQPNLAAVGLDDVAGYAQTKAGADAVALLAMAQAHMGLERQE